MSSLNKLLELLRLSTIEQLLKLSPSYLLQLYERGQMSIVCTLMGDRELRFTKHLNCTWARSPGKEIHKVPIELIKPVDFITYTNLHYSYQ